MALPTRSGAADQYRNMKPAPLGTGWELYFDGVYPVTNVNSAKNMYRSPTAKSASYQVRGIFQRRWPIKGRNEINQMRAASNTSRARSTGQAHHCEATPEGGSRTRRTKKGAKSRTRNKDPPPCENFHERRLLIWTFHRVTYPARPKSGLPPWPAQALRIADATTWLPSVRPERILRLPTSSRTPDPVCGSAPIPRVATATACEAGRRRIRSRIRRRR